MKKYILKIGSPTLYYNGELYTCNDYLTSEIKLARLFDSIEDADREVEKIFDHTDHYITLRKGDCFELVTVYVKP